MFQTGLYQSVVQTCLVRKRLRTCYFYMANDALRSSANLTGIDTIIGSEVQSFEKEFLPKGVNTTLLDLILKRTYEKSMD